MKKVLHIIGKVLLSLILFMPILGSLGIFPPPTRDLYNTDLAFAFIEMLTQASYISYMMSIVFVIALIALWTKREALAAIIITPITANVIGFHLFLDGGLLTGGAVLGNLMLALNIYLLYRNRKAYESLWIKGRSPASA
jgi:hypothetical protein